MNDDERAKKNFEVAEAIESFAEKHGLIDSSLRIYFNGIAWDYTTSSVLDKKIITDIKGSECFEYANDDTVSVSTEGTFNEHLHGYFGWKIKDAFDELLDSLGCYYELGNSWNFSIYYDEE